MPDLDQFAKNIGDIALDIEDGADKTVRKTVLAVDTVVVFATPVDRGRARSNWVAEIDQPFTGEIEPYAPGEELGLGEFGNASGALVQAAEAVAEYDGSKHNEVHITNNLPYIGVLNDGSSEQAPANFVEEAVIEGARAVKDSRILEK